jgi:hypothetical protein
MRSYHEHYTSRITKLNNVNALFGYLDFSMRNDVTNAFSHCALKILSILLSDPIGSGIG